MSSINFKRVIAGGLAAGFVMNFIDAVTNGVWLAKQWELETNALNPALAAKMQGPPIGWITVDFLLGILLVWLYAGIRPRYGAGPRTALIAAVAMWAMTHLIYASYAFMGLYSASVIVDSSIGGLVAAIAGLSAR